MRSAIEIIDKLDSHNVYESLNEDKAMILSKGNRLSDIEQRYKEEVEKAKKILEAGIDNRSWENDIIIAENEAFFKGAIRFLFTDENGTYNWSDFDIKAANAKCYFDRDGVRKDYSPILMRRLISYYDDWGMFFNITYDSTKETWLKMLLEDKWKKPIHKLLFDNSQNDLVAFQSPLADSHQKRIHEEMVQSNVLQYIEKVSSEERSYDYDTIAEIPVKPRKPVTLKSIAKFLFFYNLIVFILGIIFFALDICVF